MKNEMFLEILERSQHIGDALTTMLYAVEAMKNIDNGEQQLREIGWNIESQIGTLQEYQAETQRILEQLKSEQRERAEPAENQGKMLSREEAMDLFKKNAILLDQEENVLPFYKAIEIFGEEAAIFLERNISANGYLKGGLDYNGLGECSDERPCIDYLCKPGFFKLAVEHNYLIAVKDQKESEGAHIWKRVWAERCRRLDEQDAEYDRQREERRKKRAAAKAAKEAKEKEGN